MAPILIVFIALIIIQVGFIGVLGGKIIRHRPSHQNKTPGISVIIAARNESENLPKLLQCLADQDYPDFEVIIVNDRSADGSQQILDHWAAHHTNFYVIHQKNLPAGWTGKKYALFQAVSRANKEVLLFTDGDCLPASNQWISTMASSIDDKTDIVLGYSPYHKKLGWLNRFIQFETLFVGMQYLGFSLLGKSYMGLGRNMAIRREKYNLQFLEKIKSLTGGDDDLMISHLAASSQVKIEIRPNSFTSSQPKSSLKTYLKQKIRHLAAGKHYHKKDQTLLGIFTLSCVIVWVLFVLLIYFGLNAKLILMVFGTRSLVVYLILYRLGRKLNTDIDFWVFPFLDFCYSFYYPWVAVKALATKQVEWK